MTDRVPLDATWLIWAGIQSNERHVGIPHACFVHREGDEVIAPSPFEGDHHDVFRLQASPRGGCVQTGPASFVIGHLAPRADFLGSAKATDADTGFPFELAQMGAGGLFWSSCCDPNNTMLPDIKPDQNDHCA